MRTASATLILAVLWCGVSVSNVRAATTPISDAPSLEAAQVVNAVLDVLPAADVALVTAVEFRDDAGMWTLFPPTQQSTLRAAHPDEVLCGATSIYSRIIWISTNPGCAGFGIPAVIAHETGHLVCVRDWLDLSEACAESYRRRMGY